MNMRIPYLPEPARCEPVAVAPRQSPVLVLSDPADGSWPFDVAAQLRRTSIVAAVDATDIGSADEVRGTSIGKAERAWSRMEEEFHSACLGLVATSTRAATAACRILAKGWTAGHIPGAIVLLAYTPTFGAACLEIAERFATSRRPHDGSGARGLSVWTEWPPIMVLLPGGDPSVAECLEACGRLRTAGIPMELGVVGAARQAAPPSTDEAAQAIDRFFAQHLVPYFPKLI